MRKKFLVVGLLATILTVPILVLTVLIFASQGSRTPPPAITDLIAIDAHDGKIELTWIPSDAEDFAHYAIYASEIEITDITELSPVEQISDRVSVTYRWITRYWVSGFMLALMDGTEYWFAVTAVDLDGNASEVVTSVSATPTKIEVTPPKTAPSPIPTVFITLDDSAFNPAIVTIFAGTTVQWSSTGYLGLHTVTSDTGLFHSGDPAIFETFSYTFTETGIFGYHCELHVWETGKVFVLRFDEFGV